mgnify:FL=1
MGTFVGKNIWLDDGGKIVVDARGASELGLGAVKSGWND